MKKRVNIVNSLKLENLGKYISELLCEHDCVIIPGFGGFVARPVSAQFSRTGNMLLPPGKSLVFNKNLSNNDGLLAGHLMEKESLPYKDAIAKVEDLVAACKRTLENSRRLELNDTGLLYYNSENSLLFEPSQQKSHELNSFGLSAVHIVKLKDEEKQTIAIEPVYRVKPKGDGSKVITRISVVASSVLLLFLLIIVTAKQLPISNALASLNPFASKTPAYKMNNYGLKKLLDSEKRSVNSVKTSSFKLVENSSKIFIVKPDTVHSDKTSVIKPIKMASSSFNEPFQVVVGCFAIKNNAQKLITQLQKQNIEAVISGQNAKGLYVVSVAGFSTESMARAKLRQIKENIPSAWILVR